MAHLHLPPADVGYGWPLARTDQPGARAGLHADAARRRPARRPRARTGRDLSIYSIASRIGGRVLGYWATLLWVIAPYASILLFVGRYRGRYEDQVLPQSLGLTALADFPSMVALVVCAALCARAIDRRSRRTQRSQGSSSVSRSA